MLPRITGTSVEGRSLQRGRVMSISPTQRMPYLPSHAPMASCASGPPATSAQLVQETVVLDALQKRHHVRMRADHVGDVQQRQPHLRCDVVGDGLRERVSRVLLAQPRLQLIVEPPRGLHRRHEHLMALRIEQDPLQLLDVRLDEVEQRRSGLRRMSRFKAAMEAWLRSISSATMAGSVSIGAGRAANSGPGGPSSGSGADEAVAFEDGLQRVPDQRIGLSPGPPGGRRGPPARPGSGDVDEQPAAGLGASARGVVSCQKESPRGFMGSVIIC